MDAWKTGHRPGTTPQQWAFARVNSFTTKSSGTWGKADKDLAAKVRASEEVEIDEAKYDYFDTQKDADTHAKKHGGKVYKNTGKGATKVKGVPKNQFVVIKDEKENTELGMIPKKKRKGHEVLGPESVNEWFESNQTRAC